MTILPLSLGWDIQCQASCPLADLLDACETRVERRWVGSPNANDGGAEQETMM